MLGSCAPIAASQPGASSTNYTILHQTHDLGGGRSRQGRLTMDLSLGGIGGISQTSADTLRRGYVGQLNESPNPQPDSLIFVPGAVVRFRTQSLLSNDTDPENDPLTITGVTTPPGFTGQVSLQNGWVLYTAPAGYTGEEFFYYTASDGRGLIGSGVVTLTSWPGATGYDFTRLTVERFANGVRLGFIGLAGSRYGVETREAFDDAHPWQLLHEIDATTTGLYSLDVQLETFSTPTRFYRFFRVDL